MDWGNPISGFVQTVGNVFNNERNLAYQRANFKYQKQLQERIFQREDSAYQRAANDLQAAGLSPTLLAGGSGAGAGEAISTEASKSDNPLDMQFVQNMIEQARFEEEQALREKNFKLQEASAAKIAELQDSNIQLNKANAALIATNNEINRKLLEQFKNTGIPPSGQGTPTGMALGMFNTIADRIGAAYQYYQNKKLVYPEPRVGPRRK